MYLLEQQTSRACRRLSIKVDCIDPSHKKIIVFNRLISGNILDTLSYILSPIQIFLWVVAEVYMLNTGDKLDLGPFYPSFDFCSACNIAESYAEFI